MAKKRSKNTKDKCGWKCWTAIACAAVGGVFVVWATVTERIKWGW